MDKTKVEKFRSNGKLLLTGEYLVLDGALALALPTRLGQSMTVSSSKTTQSNGVLEWESLDEKGETWFKGIYALPDFDILSFFGNEQIAVTLKNILLQVRALAPDFLLLPLLVKVQTILEFPRDWGLGSSSTMISNIAKWAEVDPFKLLFNTLGGSGYDVACAFNNQPICYRKLTNDIWVNPVDFHPPYSNELYFVYLGQKQNSREAIDFYQQNVADKSNLIKEVSDITNGILHAKTLRAFEDLLNFHEMVLSALLSLPTAKQLHFSDYWGSVKSLGAWGGDFVLATSTKNKADTVAYFKGKGFHKVIPYNNMVIG